MVFNVSKKTDPGELLRWMLTCQQNDKKEEVLIESRGLRVEPVPVVKDYELNWEPSGLDNPNSWRNGANGDESRMTALIDDVMNIL